MMRQFELVERIKSYDPAADEDLINRAYVYAMKMHGAQKRASGDPYFSHPIEVAGILTGFKLDTAAVVTALLHDIVEDTLAMLDDVRKLFGDEVARLVDGVTKLSKIQLQNVETKQAENFRKFLIAMSEDIRVLLVKLADRLHNMRTLGFIQDPAKRRTIALETMEIYAPLAERIGIQEVKSELEDLAFAVLNPEARESILNRLKFLERSGEDIVGKVMDELDQILRKALVPGFISGREKTPYSIWRKMQVKSVSFEQLSDVMAFRVIVETREDCYRVLGLIHGAYPMVPGRFKDYISTPKRNGYRSIHTAVIGPYKQRIEVQIRTHAMHEVAELGVAAHWRYKQGQGRTEGKQYNWVRELLEILEHAQNPQEFLDHTKLEMYQDQVFCFTPKGDLIALPKGAGPVDFAYAVHSQVGDTCVGAKVNGRIVPLRTQLQNGDQVEVMTSSAQKPSPEWEMFVVTGKARAHIRRRIRFDARIEFARLGRDIVEKAFLREGFELNDKGIRQSLEKLTLPNPDELYVRVGEGRLSGRQVLIAVYPGARTPADDNVVSLSQARARQTQDGSSQPKGAVPIKGLTPGMAMHMATCCHPLPGDRIVGIAQPGKGVEVHTIDCDTLGKFSDEPDRWIDLAWDPEHRADLHIGRLNLTVANEPGALGSLSTVIAKNLGNIINLRFTKRSADFFDMEVDIEVTDVKHLANIIAALRATPAINAVDRARG